MKKIILGLVFVVLVMSACKVLATNLPVKPRVIEITWKVDSGMLNKSESIYISNDSCTYTLKVKGRKQLIKFKLKTSVIDSLYQVFYNNKFDKIETFEEEIYDRGGTSIHINVDGESYLVSNSGMTLIKEIYLANYSTVENTIKTITFDEISKQKRLIDIKLDSSITNSEHNVILYVNDKSYYQEKKDGEYLTLDLSLFSMNNLFEIYFMQKSVNQSYETVVERFNVILDELPTKNEISLILVDNQLIVK
jgi:hypothetical protein